MPMNERYDSVHPKVGISKVGESVMIEPLWFVLGTSFGGLLEFLHKTDQGKQIREWIKKTKRERED